MNSPITTHVLDTAKGMPASGVGVTLERKVVSGEWQPVGSGTTNKDGRIVDLISKDSFKTGVYRINFATGDYHHGQGFFPVISITFEVKDATQHHHVPVLLSPFGFSTYRGS